MPDFAPTPEQVAIISAVRDTGDSLMCDAKAGCAKTTTIELAAKDIRVPTLALAFNKKIKDELEKRLPPYFTVKTFNGLGHSAWAKARSRNLILNEDKLYNLLKPIAQERALIDEQFSEVLTLVRAARHAGIIPDDRPRKGLKADTPEAWDDLAADNMIDLDGPVLAASRELLDTSIKVAFNGEIDFDDQIYMSSLFGGIFPRFACVIVDEAQDLSPQNHLQIRKVSQGGRIIAVGDPRQAIYAFRGADGRSMQNLRALSPKWLDFPLNTTFRCSKAVVRRQQSFVPGFTAAESNPEGEIIDLRMQEWDLGKLPIGSNLAIISRNNAPVIAMALKLIARGVGAVVLGQDIGKALIKLVDKICGKEQTLPVEECRGRIIAWIAKEIDRAQAKGKQSRVAAINDRGNALLAVIDNSNAASLGDIKSRLNFVFSERNPQVTLCTGHRSKGLEWTNVVHLNPNLIPSKFAHAAKEEGNMIPWEQDMNLKYVIETRAKVNLILAHLDDFEGGEDGRA